MKDKAKENQVFCIVANQVKDVGFNVANQLKDFLTKQGKEVLVVSSAEELTKDKAIDVAITLGGDGTMIQAAKYLTQLQIPMIGVNLGTLGFLTEVEKRDIFSSMQNVIDGKYWIQNRIALTGETRIGTIEQKIDIAINDCTIGKRGFGRMITIHVYVNNELVDTYVADGVLVATPTGSTAYNLSAGGPILSPSMEGFVITPICPHALNKRSIVCSSEDEITVRIGQTREGQMDKASISVDGQPHSDATTNDTIVLRKAKEHFQLIRVTETGFYERMRSKLNRN